MVELYIVVSDCGDGSYYPRYTMNKKWIEKMDKEGEYPDIGCDGDGFHYDTLTLPDGVTLESLGVTDIAEDEDD